MAKNPRLIDLSGQRFGDWLVLEQAGNTPRGGALWRCKCACGVEKIVHGADIRGGKSQNCGCLKAARIGALRRTHGRSGTRLYNIWQLMRSRCEKEYSSHHNLYGARGIAVCPDWQIFDAFYNWAINNGYKSDLSIDRVDNDLGYSPENCRWSNKETQSQNRRFVRRMADGTLGLTVARSNGIPDHTYRVRLHNGWTVDRAATQPYRTRSIEQVRDEAGKFA